jgi:hypothetical protein
VLVGNGCAFGVRSYRSDASASGGSGTSVGLGAPPDICGVAPPTATGAAVACATLVVGCPVANALLVESCVATAVVSRFANGWISTSAAAVAVAWASGGKGVPGGAFGSIEEACAGMAIGSEGRKPAPFRLFGFKSPTRQIAISTTTLKIVRMAPTRGR